ncbi:hypothetical protein YC2023_117774 [Brassica napus]
MPTYVQLCLRGIDTDPTCQRCCVEEETINHVLFICPQAQATWRCSGLPFLNFQSQDLEENISSLFALMNSTNIPTISWVLWYIWKSMNELLFAKRNVHLMEDIFIAVETNDEWISFYVSTKSKLGNAIKRYTWETPSLGWFKCNFDCSFRKEIGIAGVGWIVRNENRLFMCAGMVRIHNVLSALQGEALGFLFAMQQVWRR